MIKWFGIFFQWNASTSSSSYTQKLMCRGINTYVWCVRFNCLYLLPIGQFAQIHTKSTHWMVCDTHTSVKQQKKNSNRQMRTEQGGKNTGVFVTTTDSIAAIIPKHTTQSMHGVIHLVCAPVCVPSTLAGEQQLQSYRKSFALITQRLLLVVHFFCAPFVIVATMLLI